MLIDARPITLTTEAYMMFAKKVGFIPTPAQIPFLQSQVRFIVLIAGTRYGKSITASLRPAAQIYYMPRLTGKPVTWWVVAPTYKLAEKEFGYIRNFLLIAGEKFITDTSTHGNMVIVTERGSRLEAKVAERGSERGLLGDEVDGMLFSEAAQIRIMEEIWDRYALRGLATRSGEAIFPTTSRGFGTIHGYYKKGKDPSIPEWESFGPYTSIQGGGMSLQEYEYARRTIGKEAFREQYEGRFTKYSGLVYPEFDTDTHVVDISQYMDMKNMSQYQLLVGIDFGYENPSAAIFAAKVSGRYLIFKEIYGKHMLLPDFANKIKAEIDRIQSWSKRIYADHDAGNRAWMRKLGISTKPAKKDVDAGIQYVKKLLLGAGQPAMLIDKSCENLIYELERYHWLENQMETKNRKEEPAKVDDHAVDSLRYLTLSNSNIRIRK